jgi:hypothetical protein
LYTFDEKHTGAEKKYEKRVIKTNAKKRRLKWRPLIADFLMRMQR